MKEQGIEIDRIEDIGKGTALCTLLKNMDDGFPVFKKDPWNENDYQYNLRQVESYLNKRGVKMHLPVERMIKLKMQDNLEVLQAVYKYCNTEKNKSTDGRRQPVEKELDRRRQSTERRINSCSSTGRSPSSNQSQSIGKGRDSDNFSCQNVASTNQIQFIEPENRASSIRDLSEVNKRIEIFKNERDFYFKKLVEIERILKESEEEGEKEMKEKIYRVMYRQ